MRFTFTALLLTVLTVAGCGSGYDDPFDQPRRQADPRAFGVAVDPLAPAPVATPPAQPDRQSKSQAEQQNQERATAARREKEAGRDEVAREKADVGVGKKGHYRKGLITTPISVFFRTQEMITFRIQIPHAMDLYKALNGRAPRTHEEFMQKIIKENMIDLPDLPPGCRYIYDPKTEQLMVEHPA